MAAEENFKRVEGFANTVSCGRGRDGEGDSTSLVENSGMRSSSAVRMACPITGMSSTLVSWTLSRSQKMWQR